MVKKHGNRNPLRKRLWRELRDDAGKYIVLFLLMMLSIGFISGFLVADNSMIAAYDESFEKYNIEDGHFETKNAMNRAQRKVVNGLGITVYDLFYTDTALQNGTTMRLYGTRTEVDLVCLMEGSMPAVSGELAIDRMYADNNGLAVGSTLSDGTRTWTVTGLVALSDYSALFADNADSMFDATMFGAGIVTQEEFDGYSASSLSYVYAWKYDETPADEAAERDAADDLLEALAREVHLEDFVPRYANQAIQFTGTDMGGDRAIMTTLLYAIIVIIAFVLAVTAVNTITREANVIGTLRATGYTQGELTRHYMSMPLLVTVVSSLLGNILGYTLLKDVCADMYYASYSLPTYVTIWNADAFLMTTIVPFIIMLAVNYLILRRRLKLPPLKFLRRELSRKKNLRAIHLPKRIPFFTRFRLRVVGQNLSNYLILLVGILFANFLLLFGLMLPDVLENYQADIESNLLADYQYMLSVPLDATGGNSKLESTIAMLRFMSGVETDVPDAEKFSIYTLETTEDAVRIEDVLLYGVEPGSRYVAAELSDGAVFISSALAEKNHFSAGDVFTLNERYGGDSYDFTVDGIYDYNAGLAVFMDRAALNRLMGEDADYFCGYFSNSPITDIDEDYLGTVVTIDDLTKVSRQLDVSMGEMMYMVDAFSVVIFLVLIYLLSKIIIEKNAQSISMTKILGYSRREIGRLYILPTTVVVIVLLVASIPLEKWLMRVVFIYYISAEMSGWMPFDVSRSVYVEMFVLGAAAYAVVALLEHRRIRRIPMDEALKNVE